MKSLKKNWWIKDLAFDEQIKARFSKVHASVAAGECEKWRSTPEGRLAEIIVLDQFSRNMFRDTAKAFSFDSTALVLAQTCISVKDDSKLPVRQRMFAYLPFMHSESKVIHEQAVSIFEKLGLEGTLDFELKHKVIIDKFGRYPHRNEILGRVSTREEIEFLEQPGSSF